MSIKMNSEAYSKLINEDIKWLLLQPRTVEREHAIAVLEESSKRYAKECAHQPVEKTQKLCNRKACRAPGANYWNTSTREWYCQKCADAINAYAYHDPVALCLSPHDVQAFMMATRPMRESVTQGWQPMNTVPDDVMTVLGYCAPGGQDGGPCIAEITYVEIEGRPHAGWWEAVDGNPFYPTHWMPAPEYPTTQIEVEPQP